MRHFFSAILLLLLGASTLTARAQGYPVAPTQPSTAFRLVHSSCTVALLSWQPGNNEGSLVVAVENQGTAPSPFPAADSGYASTANADVRYAPHTNNGGLAVYAGAGAQVVLRHLRPGSSYTLFLYSYNQSITRDTAVYALQRDSLTLQTPTGCPSVPSVRDSALQLSGISCKWANLTWARGNGQQSLVVVRDGLGATIQPGPDTVYAAYPSMLYAPIIAPGARVVYAGSGNQVSLANLEKGHTYSAWVYGYNTNTAGDTASYTDQHAFVADLTFTVPNCPDMTPTVAASNLQAQTIDCSTIRLTCTPGNGEGRLFVIRKSNALLFGNTSVQNEQFYPPSNLWARGFPNQPDCYAVYAGPASEVTVYGLPPDQAYKVAVYEYNTVPGPYGFPDGNTPFYQSNGLVIALGITPRCAGTEPTADPTAFDDPSQTCCARIEDGTLTPTSVRINWHPSMTKAHYLRDLFGNVLNDNSGNPCCPVPARHQANDGVGSYVVIHNALTPGALVLPVQNTVPAVCSTVYGQGSPVRPGQDSVYSVKLTQQWDDSTVTITGLRPGTVYFADIFTFRYPTPQPGNPVATTPYTYYLSAPQASVSIVTPQLPPHPLPVTLTAFTAQCRPDGGVDLRWVTATELNNAYYAVERSTDGRVFAEVGRMTAAGSGTSSAPSGYYWQDIAAPSGMLYYRLRQVDRNNGPATFGPVRSVSACPRPLATVSVAPNPLPEGITPRLYATGLPAQTLSVRVLDVLGREVYAEQLPSSPDGGSSALALRGRHLSAGVYVVLVRSAQGRTWATRLIAQ
jgi:hypothetical protein